MAIGDIGMFTPAEEAYTQPGSYDAMLQGEALKRASYLASMDQFFENLAETKREFDKTLEFKTETRDLELAWAREQFEGTIDLERDKLDWQKEYGSRELDLKERALSIESRGQLSPNDIKELMEMKYENTENLFNKVFGGGVSGRTPSVSPPTNKYGQVVGADYGSIQSGKVTLSSSVSPSGAAPSTKIGLDEIVASGWAAGPMFEGSPDAMDTAIEERPEDWYDWEIG